jgi:hypothetical protein
MATKKKTPKKAAQSARKSRKRSHHQPHTVEAKLNHLLYSVGLIMKRDRQSLRESREQTEELAATVKQLNLAITHTDAMLAEVGHADALIVHYGPGGLGETETDVAGQPLAMAAPMGEHPDSRSR